MAPVPVLMEDKKSKIFKEHSYSADTQYKEYSQELLEAHEVANVLGHALNINELVEGDVINTVPIRIDSFQEVQFCLMSLVGKRLWVKQLPLEKFLNIFRIKLKNVNSVQPKLLSP